MAIARQAGKDFMGRIDPDGRFAVWESKRLENKHVKVSKAEVQDETLAVVRQMQATAAAMGVNLSQRRVSPGMSEMLRGIPEGCDPKGPGLSRDANSEKPSKPRGSGGLTKHGARLIRNGGALIERRYGTRCCSMFTGTFPDLTAEDWESVRLNWSEGWNLFVKKLTYHLKENKLCPGIVACFEVQPDRNRKDGSPALHVHLLMHARRRPRGRWLVDRTLMNTLWRETWENYLSREYQWNAACQTVMVVKSVSSYLGKYLSKGLGEQSSPMETTSGEPLLRQWYAVSMCVRKWIDQATLKSSSVGEFLRLGLEEGDPALYWYSWVKLELADGRIVPIVCFGSSHYRNLDYPPPWDIAAG